MTLEQPVILVYGAYMTGNTYRMHFHSKTVVILDYCALATVFMSAFVRLLCLYLITVPIRHSFILGYCAFKTDITEKATGL